MYTRGVSEGDRKPLKMKCPQCGKRHDPKNRLLQLGYDRDGYWKVDKC
jgi:hypothetical protein